VELRWAQVDSGPRGFTSPALTAHRPCPVCDSLWNRPFLELSDYQFYLDDPETPKRATVRNVECGDCFAAFLDPVYTTTGFALLFSEAERSYGTTEARVAEQASWISERRLLADGVTILDVGCYSGDLLAVMPAGVRRTGVDIDAAAIERGRRRLGATAELIVGDFESFPVSMSPDCITMFHVLEHLQHPRPVLARLRDASHGDTRLVVEVPVLEGSPTNDLFGFFAPQHTTHFSRRSLTNCLAQAGWRAIESHQQPDYNGYRVLCKPAEPRPPLAGDPEDAVRVRTLLADWHRAAVEAIRACARLAETERCVIWGGGMHLEQIYATLPLFHARPDREYLIIDSDPVKHGGTWRGIDIVPPDVLNDPATKKVPLLVSSYGSQPEIVDAALKMGVGATEIVTLYDETRTY
jgi:hypothetical protein